MSEPSGDLPSQYYQDYMFEIKTGRIAQDPDCRLREYAGNTAFQIRGIERTDPSTLNRKSCFRDNNVKFTTLLSRKQDFKKLNNNKLFIFPGSREVAEHRWLLAWLPCRRLRVL